MLVNTNKQQQTKEIQNMKELAKKFGIKVGAVLVALVVYNKFVAPRIGK